MNWARTPLLEASNLNDVEKNRTERICCFCVRTKKLRKNEADEMAEKLMPKSMENNDK